MRLWFVDSRLRGIDEVGVCVPQHPANPPAFLCVLTHVPTAFMLPVRIIGRRHCLSQVRGGAMINEQLNWGVLGAARIATNQMIPAIQQSDTGRVAAIASRSAAKASDVAEHFGIDRSYGSYDDLLADPDIDVIYNPLPNSMHLEWSVKSAKAGKHILCEKPLGATADECRQMIDAAAQNNVLLIEAFWYRYHPKNLMIKEMVDDGSLGTLRAVRAYHYGTETRPTTSIAMSSELAGGALLFGGCYPVNLSRWLFGREPKTVSAIFEFDPLYKVDVTFNGLLDFGANQHGIANCGFHHAEKSRYEVIGERGYAVVEPFLTGDPGAMIVRFEIDGRKFERQTPPANAFVIQVDAFTSCLKGEAESLTTAEDAAKNMTVIDSLFRSGRTGRHVAIPE